MSQRARFEVDDGGPRDDLPGGEERRTPVHGTAPAGSPRRGRRGRAPMETAPSAPGAPALPWPVRPGVLVFLGAILSAVLWLGFVNPEHGVYAAFRCWPWELFRAKLGRGGPPVFLWDKYRAVALLGAVLVVGFLALSVLRSSPRRALGVLLLVILGGLHFYVALGETSLYAAGPGSPYPLAFGGLLATALAAGAVFAREGVGGGRGGRWMLLVPTLVVGAWLLMPRPGVDAYDALVLDLSRPFAEVLSGARALGTSRLLEADGLLAIGLALLLGLGVVTLFGLRGRWTTPLAVALVLATAILPALLHHGAKVPAPDLDGADLLTALSQPNWVVPVSVAVVFLAALTSLLGIGGRWALGAAGVGLGLLVLVGGSAFFRLGVTHGEGLPPFFAGLDYLTRYLSAHGGAFLAPLAAVVLDRRASTS